MALSSNQLFEHRWRTNLLRDESGSPLLSPLFVIGQGSGVAIIDVRDPEDATGALGYVHGSVFMDGASLDSESPENLPVVLVSRTGRQAARLALTLEQAGWPHVAALEGGLVAWRKLGLKTSRDPAGVRERLHEITPVSDEGVSQAHVEHHIGDPRNVRWIKLASMATYGHCACIDGRDERGVVGTLGGDAGEFLLSLAAVEKATGIMMDEDTVARALATHLDAFGEFYMHSDLHAFEALGTALREDPRLTAAVEGLKGTEALAEFLSHPELGLWDTLLEHIVVPDHIGCGHIRLMLQHSDEYGIRSDLVVSFMRAFYRQWWEGPAELTMTLLPGGHEEAAVLNIRTEEELWDITPIPLICPAVGGRQMFVNHPDVVSYLRSAVVRFHLEGYGAASVSAEQEAKLRVAFDELAAQQLTATIGHLAKGLPIYDVSFARDGSFTVSEA